MPIRSFAAALAALAVFGAAPASVRAQASAATASGAQVTSVAGFPWGTTYQQIVAQRGRPSFEQREAEGLVSFSYGDQVLGRDVYALFFVHPVHGLVRGGYMAPASSAAECDMVMRAFENIITRRYPGLPMEERSIGELGGNPCAAALGGTGGYLEAWTDPANGVRIILALLPGQGGPMLTYSTPEADAWERRKNDARF